MDAITYGSILESRMEARKCRQTSGWTPARIARLKELHASNAPYPDIAREFGLTKSAVCGKIHRLGMSVPAWQKPKRIRAPKPARKKRPTAFRPERLSFLEKFPVLDLPADVGLRTELSCDIMGLTSQNCHWPIGTPGTEEFFFCGQAAVKGRSYCGAHCRVAYAPTKSERPRFRSHSGNHFVGR